MEEDDCNGYTSSVKEGVAAQSVLAGGVHCPS